MDTYHLLMARKLKSDSNCWLADGAKDKDGYGKIKIDGKSLRIHRVSYEYFKGKLKYQALHTCPNKNCFNPEHLYDGTHVDNMIDRKNSGNYINQNKYKTHCKRGHDLSKGYKNSKTGARQCNICRRKT